MDPEKPLLDYIFVDMQSTEFILFLKRLHENVPELLKDFVCTRCWGLVARH